MLGRPIQAGVDMADERRRLAYKRCWRRKIDIKSRPAWRHAARADSAVRTCLAAGICGGIFLRQVMWPQIRTSGDGHAVVAMTMLIGGEAFLVDAGRRRPLDAQATPLCRRCGGLKRHADDQQPNHTQPEDAGIHYANLALNA